MITVNDFSACITIDGQPCQEYGVDMSQETRMATCWIASEIGKEYEVNWKACTLYGPVSGRVRIDGHECGGLLMQTSQAGPMYTVKGLSTSPTTLHRFAFSSVKTTDSDDTFIPTPTSLEVGEIRLTIRNTRVIETDAPVHLKSVPTEATFHETTKKCINHQTSFRPTTAPKRRFSAAEDYGIPMAVFCFKYRPLGILQANGITPPPTPQRSPTPTPNLRLSGLKRSYSSENSDAEDVKPELDISEDEDDAQLRDLQNQIEAVRARKKAKAQSSRKKIKREPLVGVTIDLTLSD